MKQETTADGSQADFPEEAAKVMVATATAFSHGCGGVLASGQTSGDLMDGQTVDVLQTSDRHQGEDAAPPSCKRSREEAGSCCRLKELSHLAHATVRSGAVFWPSSWRSKLCTCHGCQVRLT